MATKDSVIRVRVESELKADVEKIIKPLGLNYSEVINIFLNMIKLNNGLPFPVKIPNAETVKTLEKSSRGEEVTPYASLEAAKKDAENW